MGRGRGKGKNQSFTADLGGIASCEDGKMPARRRGRPQKLLKHEIVEEGKIVTFGDVDDADDHDLDGTKSLLLSKSSKNNQAAMENGRKRNRPFQVEENENLVNGQSDSIIIKTNDNEFINVRVGYRPNGSRRKNNKPRRAAEVGFKLLSGTERFCTAD